MHFSLIVILCSLFASNIHSKYFKIWFFLVIIVIECVYERAKFVAIYPNMCDCIFREHDCHLKSSKTCANIFWYAHSIIFPIRVHIRVVIKVEYANMLSVIKWAATAVVIWWWVSAFDEFISYFWCLSIWGKIISIESH